MTVSLGVLFIFFSRLCLLLTNKNTYILQTFIFILGISALLLNPNTHKNIKMFWVKVIDNMTKIFRNFAQYFLEPLLQFLSDKIAGNDLNYFVSDVVRKT